MTKSIIKLTLKNKQICTQTYDFLIKTLSMSFKLKKKKISLNFFFFENQRSAFYSKKKKNIRVY